MFDFAQPAEQQAAAPTEPAQQAPTDTDFLERFNKLASKEAPFRKRDQDMRAERDSWKSKVERLERLEKLASENPDDLLNEFGLNYDKLTERRLTGLGGEQERMMSNLQKELQDIKSQLESKKKAEDEQSVSRSLQEANAEIRRICDSEEFELIKTQEAYDLVLDVASEAFQAGKHVTLQEAAKYVEAHLEKKLEALLSAKKVKARLEPKEPPSELQQKEQFGMQQKPSLSSSQFSASSRPTPTPVTEDDLRQAFWRAMNAGSNN
jgi:hypothetical protein